MEDLRKSTEQLETFADLQDMMMDVLGGKAKEITSAVTGSDKADKREKDAKREQYLKQIAADIAQSKQHFRNWRHATNAA